MDAGASSAPALSIHAAGLIFYRKDFEEAINQSVFPGLQVGREGRGRADCLAAHCCCQLQAAVLPWRKVSVRHNQDAALAALIGGHPHRRPPHMHTRTQGGPHNHTISGLACALKQAATPEFKSYQEQVGYSWLAWLGLLSLEAMFSCVLKLHAVCHPPTSCMAVQIAGAGHGPSCP